MEKSKKVKIFTFIICTAVIIFGIIASIVLITQKKHDLTPNKYPDYNNHTMMFSANLDKGYQFVNGSTPAYYSNGNVMVQNMTNSGIGLFSFSENTSMLTSKEDPFLFICTKSDFSFFWHSISINPVTTPEKELS